MVTTTTPSRLNERPSYQGLTGEPAAKPPPWIQTMTGRRRPGSPGAGVKTLTFSVSSPGTHGSGNLGSRPSSRRWGVAPGWVASRTPLHGCGGCGAANRRTPTGAAAYGIPRKTAPPLFQVPRTSPPLVVTTGSVTLSMVVRYLSWAG